MKQLGIPLIWILLSGALIAPIASLPAFAVNATSTTIVSSQNSSTLGQSVIFTATIAPSTATGIVIFNDTSTNPPAILDISIISGGIATFSTSSLSVGTHNIVAIYVGDASNSPSTSAVLTQTVNKINTTTTVTSSLNPSSFGQSVNFTATVSPVSGSFTPIGTIQFLVNGTVMGSPVTLTDGKATFTSSSLSVGTHSISAIYSGNTIFATSAGLLIQTIHQIGTSMSIVSSQNPSTFGQSITFTATVLTNSATGTVQFNDTSVTPHVILGTVTLSGGTAVFSTSLLSVGSHTIVAKYFGDINNVPSTSNVITQTVNSIAPSTISISSNATSIISGHFITFTAVISPSSATGTVQFKVNGTNLGAPVILSGGHVIFSTSSLPPSSDIISASYSGNNNFTSSTSNSITILVASASQDVTVEKINGKIKIDKGENLKFDINSKNGTKFNGHLNYHDKTAHFVLHSKQITSLSMDNSMTHIIIMGQAKITGNPHDGFASDQLTFSVSIIELDKKGDNDQFSIVVTDNSGKVVYQKSGTAQGQIKINKVKSHLPDINTHKQDNDTQNDNLEKTNVQNDDSKENDSQKSNLHSQDNNSQSDHKKSHSKNNKSHSD